MTDRTWIADDDALNRRALRALMNFCGNRERALAELLRSDVPIHWAVREALADALEGKPQSFGSPLSFDGTNATKKIADRYEVRLRRLEIARWIRSRQNHAPGYERALDEAAERFNCSRQKCRDSVTYINRMDEWVKSVRLEGTKYGSWSVEELEERFLGSDAAQEPLPPNMTAEQMAAEDDAHLQLLIQIFGDPAPDS
ncbi:MAG: hypothetical protein AB7E24_14730 [Novosphingobium sp.]